MPYAWPASRISRSDMAALYRAKHRHAKKTTITQLIAMAVREKYGNGIAAEPVQQPDANARRAA